jgi:hypothetical protein
MRRKHPACGLKFFSSPAPPKSKNKPAVQDMGVQCVHFDQPHAPCPSLCGVRFDEVELIAEKLELGRAAHRQQHAQRLE